MSTDLKILLIASLILFGWTESCAQTQNETISSIHEIEPAQNHYVRLKQLSPIPNPALAEMDELAFPSDLYNPSTILMAMLKPEYLHSSQVDFLVKAVKYPANSSAQTRAELDFLLELQERRTASQIERVMELAQIGYWPHANYLSTHTSYKENLAHLFFECEEVIGTECTAANYPATSHLLQGVMNDMRVIEFAVKFHHLRARPYQLESRLEPLREIGSPSFASGHTLWAYIQAYTFSELLPEKRQAFVKLAYEIALSRELMGVHYPSDEEVARQLAHRMLALMWNTDKFQQDFAKAKEEWE